MKERDRNKKSILIYNLNSPSICLECCGALENGEDFWRLTEIQVGGGGVLMVGRLVGGWEQNLYFDAGGKLVQGNR